MKRDINALKEDRFDLIVIGGGIVGTGIARDASLRGLRTLLVEKEDFAYGTTSRSTRLIHGGLRYLRMLEFKLVKQDLFEREVLLHIAPHLVHELRFVIPLLRSTPFYRYSMPIGLRLYDFLARDKSLPSWQRLNRRGTLAVEPSLAEVDGLVGACLYYDCQAEYMERLCLENALDAAVNGSTLLNHAVMTDLFVKDGAVTGIKVKDRQTGEDHEAHGRVVVNAGGPWADFVWDRMTPGKHNAIRRTKGIHLLTRRLSNDALVLFAKSDGRLFFIIPWGQNSLVGTTDTDFNGDLDNVYAEKSDIDYLVTETQNYFHGFSKKDIHYTMAGLRPLVASGAKAQSNVSRAHRLIDHERQDGIKNFVSVLGGKITAYRGIAEEALDLVCRKLKHVVGCDTAARPLPGAPLVKTEEMENIARQEGISLDTVKYLAGIYGSRLTGVLEYVHDDARLGASIIDGQPAILAQIKHAVEEEQALTVQDFLLRRSLLGLSPSRGLDCLTTVAREMGALLGWDQAEIQKQEESYRSGVAPDLDFLA